MSNPKKEWSIKAFLFESEYSKLKAIADDLDIPLKNLINSSIRFAIKDFETNKSIRRSSLITYYENETVKEYSFKIKDNYYDELKRISQLFGINAKELLKYIMTSYPELLQKMHEGLNL